MFKTQSRALGLVRPAMPMGLPGTNGPAYSGRRTPIKRC